MLYPTLSIFYNAATDIVINSNHGAINWKLLYIDTVYRNHDISINVYRMYLYQISFHIKYRTVARSAKLEGFRYQSKQWLSIHIIWIDWMSKVNYSSDKFGANRKNTAHIYVIQKFLTSDISSRTKTNWKLFDTYLSNQ